MKKLLLLALFAPILAFAQSKFDGTWRLDLQSAQLPDKPQQYSLENETYTCSTCTPPISVKADGQDHAVANAPYFDTLSVKIVDDRHVVVIGKKAGKLAAEQKFAVSDDGKTLTLDGTYYPPDAAQPIVVKETMQRTAESPKGSSQVTGSWREDKIESASNNATTVNYKSTGDGLSFNMPTGESYFAKFDGKDYPYKGNPGITSVSIKKIDESTIEETDKRDGKVIYVSRMTVSPDGKTITFDQQDKLQNTTSKFTANKEAMSAEK